MRARIFPRTNGACCAAWPSSAKSRYRTSHLDPSFRLDIAGADHRCPFRTLGSDLSRELIRGATDRVQAKCCQAFPHVRRCNTLNDLAIKHGDDLFRRSDGNEDAYPAV